MKGEKQMKFENNELCRECGGKCCQASSCLYAPEDFKEISVEHFLRLYNEGKIMFSRVSQLDGGTPFNQWLVKPAQVATPRIQTNIMVGNSPCIHLTEKGCEITDYYHRPRGAKLLEPKLVEIKECRPQSFLTSLPISFVIEDCKTHFTVEKALEEWKPFAVILEATVEHILAEERLQIQEFSYSHEVCKMCGGRCCKVSGCSFAPTDFKEISYTYLKKLISKGFISIITIPDIQSGLEEDILSLKVRNKGARVCDLDVHLARPCILLEETGCFFEDEDRPYGGRALVPNLPEIGCKMGYSYRQCALDWRPYQKLLRELYNYFYHTDIPFNGIV